ncbi:MAG: rubrerythrin family protein [Spirochaetes bacterium]|jgi:rubrerythrin|nr:rubrerythrin family protein [Spirochaetota bacterium]
MRQILIIISVAAMTLSIAAGCKGESKTVINLKAAITGETTASAKYAAYAKKADDEGFGKIAALFRAASKAEAIHAANHAAVLEKMGQKMSKITPKFEVKPTKENLEDAIKGESYEIKTMYPEFIKTAGDEKINEPVESFNFAMDTEKVHLAAYTEALVQLKKKDMKKMPAEYMVCPRCGNTFGENVPNICNICGEPKAKFISIK